MNERYADVPLRAKWLLLGLAGGVAAVLVMVRLQRSPAGSYASRHVEARLSGGFPWTPLRTARGGKAESTTLSALQARGALSDAIQGDDHAAAIAKIFLDQPRHAVASLRQIAEKTNSADAWSDLAAAEFEIAVSGSPEHLKTALASADAALDLNQRSPEALFNRALTIEALGMRDLAAKAWRSYLEVDPSSGWSDEALAHLHTLAEPRPDFRHELNRLYDTLAVGNQSVGMHLATEFPQECRTWSKSEILGRWAEEFGHDSTAAKRHLGVARTLAAALRRQRDEQLLFEDVRTIETATAQQQKLLAEAHRSYRIARIAYATQSPTEAEKLLRSAADLFARAGSPMAFVAQYYTANTLYDQNRIAEASTLLASLRRGVPDRFIALRAQVEWETGLCAYADARWADALRALPASIEGFDHLGEEENAAFARGILSDIYETIGAFRPAWQNRVVAIRSLSAHRSRRLQPVLSGLSRTTIRQRDWHAAESFLRLEFESVDATGDLPLKSDTLLRRALVRAQLRENGAAREDLNRARDVIVTIADAAQRERRYADWQIADGIVSGAEAPQHAINVLSAALTFHARGDRRALPEILLSRSRAYVSAGQHDLARKDLDLAMDEVDLQRASSPVGDVRAGIIDVAGDIFDDAVENAIAHGDAARALDCADRARARVLLDRAVSKEARQASTPPDSTAFIEYVVSRQRLLIFVADKQITVDQVPLDAASIDIPTNSSDLKATGRSLYELLIRPIEQRITRCKRLVIVVDPALQGVPFAGLLDARTNQYLVETHTIVITPSLRFHLAAGGVTSRANARVLAVGAAGLRALVNADREAKTIAALYPASRLLTGSNASRERLIANLVSFDVIHFAGHAAGTPEGGYGFLALTPTGRDDGILYASDIADLDLRNIQAVILAGCATNRGEYHPYEGEWSVARGFLAAGAASVVATLWPIDDEASSAFFIRLHQYLRRGFSTADALRETQLEFLHRGEAASLWTAVQALESN